MRICLFFNETAGGGISLKALTKQITDVGHHVARVIDRMEDLRAHLSDEIDCVVAAGGDGTIARAARALFRGETPLAILPLGTANNVATSLAIEGELDALIARWSLDRIVRIDVGVVETTGVESCFFESVGFGLVTECIEEARRALSKDDPATHLDDARELYVDRLDRLESRCYSIRVGGEELKGDFVLVEAMNTPRVGPGINLTSGASVADGFLSIVSVTSSEKARLRSYLQELRDGAAGDAGFKSIRAPEIEVHGATRMHIDDRIDDVSGSIKIRVAAASLPVLA